jgi:hypothetical protein
MTNSDGVRTGPKNPYKVGWALLAVLIAVSFFYIFAPNSVVESIYHLCVRVGLEDIVLLAPRHQSMRAYLIETNNFAHWQSVASYLSTCFIAMVCCLSVSLYRMYDYIPYFWSNNEKWWAKTHKERIKASGLIITWAFFILSLCVFFLYLKDQDWNRHVYKMPAIEKGSPMYIIYSCLMSGVFLFVLGLATALTSLFFIEKKRV